MNPKLNETDAAITESIKLGKEQLQSDINFTVQQNTKINPDKAGETAEKSQQAGFSFELGMENEEILDDTVKTQELNNLNLPTTAPVLASQIASNQQLAQVSHDDLPELARVEQEIKKADITASGWKGWGAYLTPVGSSMINQAKAGWYQTGEYQGLLRKQMDDGDLSDEEYKRLDYLKREIASLQNNDQTFFGTLASMAGFLAGVGLDTRTILATSAGALGGSVIPGAGTVAGALTGFEAGFLGNLLEIYAATSYDKHINNGVERDTALVLAATEALTQAALDFTAARVLGGGTKIVPTSKSTALITEEAAKKLQTPFAKHKILEFIERKGWAFVKLLMLNMTKNVVDAVGTEGGLLSQGKQTKLETPEGRQEVLDELTDNFREEVFLAVTLGLLAKKARKRLTAIESATERKAHRAAEKAAFIELEDAVLATKTKERSPTTTADFLSKQFENTGIKNIHIKADVFNEIIAKHEIPIDKLERYIPGITNQLEASQAVKGDVVIPLGNYLAHFSGTEAGDDLNEHISFTQTIDEPEATEEKQREEEEEARKNLEERLEEIEASKEIAKNKILSNFNVYEGIITSEAATNYHVNIMTAFVNSQSIIKNVLPHEALGRIDAFSTMGLDEKKESLVDTSLIEFIDDTNMAFAPMYLDTINHEESSGLVVKSPKNYISEDFSRDFRQFLFEGKKLDPKESEYYRDYVYFLASLRNAGVKTNSANLELMLTRIEETVAAVEDKSNEIVIVDNKELTEEQVRDFRDLAAKAKWEAIQIVLREAMTDANQTTDLTEQPNSLREAVKEKALKEIEKDPVYIATKELKAGVLDPSQNLHLTADQLRVFVEENPNALPYTYAELENLLGENGHNILAEKTTSQESATVEDLAELFGYDSPAAFLTKLAQTVTSEMMLMYIIPVQMEELFDSTNNEKVIGTLLNSAINNEYAKRLNVNQISAFFKLDTTSKAIAKAVAEALSKETKKEVAQIKFSQVERMVHYYSELIKEKYAGLSLLERLGNLPESIHHLYRIELAKNIVEQLSKIQQEIAGFSSQEIKTLNLSDQSLVNKSYDMKYVNLGRAILAHFGMIEGVTQENLAEYIANITKYDKDILDSQRFKWAERNAVDFNDLTLDVFSDLKRYVSGALEKAKDYNLVKTKYGEQETNEVVAGLLEVLHGEDRTSTKFSRLHDALVIPEHLLYEMDGHQYGAFTQAIATPMFNSLNDYQVENAKILQPLVTSLRKLDIGRGMVTAEKLGIDDSDFVFGKETGGSGKLEILAALLSTGNEANYKNLLLGRGWGTETNGILDDSRWKTFIETMVNKGEITKEHLDWVQSVWDAYSELYPDIQAAFREIHGYNTLEVPRREISTPIGIFRGGYIPVRVSEIVYTPKKAITLKSLKKAVFNEDIEFQQSVSTATNTQANSRRSSSTEESEDVPQALTLDLAVILASFDNKLKSIKLIPTAANVLKILENEEFRKGVGEKYPDKIDHILLPFIENTISQKVTIEDTRNEIVNKALSVIRRSSSIALLAGNIKNTLEQVVGIYAASTDLKLADIGVGLVDSFFNPRQIADFINEKSNFMLIRSKDSARILRAEIDTLAVGKGKISRGLDLAAEKSLAPQHLFQSIIDRAVWLAKFKEVTAKQRAALAARDTNSALYNELKDLSPAELEKKAVEEADHIIRHVLENFNAASYATVQFGNPLWRSFLQFYTYSNKNYNLILSNFKKAWGEEKLTDKIKYVLRNVVGLFAAASIVPVLIGSLLAFIFRGFETKEKKEDDPSVFMEYILQPMFSHAFSFAPFGGSAARFMFGPGNSLAGSPTTGWGEDVIKSGEALIDAATDDEKERLTDIQKKQLFHALSIAPGFSVMYAILYNLHLSQMYEDDESN